MTQTVSSYISFCVDTNIPEKNITVYPNNKPWVIKDFKNVLNMKKKKYFVQETTRKGKKSIKKNS